MTALPDFTTMSAEQIGEWFLDSDTSALIAAAARPDEPMVHVDQGGSPVASRRDVHGGG
ncbi:hypothetical protein AB0K00_47150 [Dactylosporangium sp. NPDC049525]|uniref:hypothetical protein n=1 Tax=Dactylosporangium sp. NPDC049525 TaxID=3154730 RepID=UPI0034188BE4